MFCFFFGGGGARIFYLSRHRPRYFHFPSGLEHREEPTFLDILYGPPPSIYMVREGSMAGHGQVEIHKCSIKLVKKGLGAQLTHMDLFTVQLTIL